MRALEKIDKSLLRQILGAHSKTPLEVLYLELGCKPLRFYLMSKRVNYLHYLLNLKETELLHKVFTAQLKNPVKGDWVLQIMEDLKTFQLPTDFNKIKEISKTKFKNMVKNNANVASLIYLEKFKVEHSKMKNLEY